MMKKTLAVAVGAMLALALGACGDDDDDHDHANTQDKPAASAAASVAASAGAAASKQIDAKKPPAPSQATAQAYVARLREIDNTIVSGSTSQALVERGLAQCETIYSTADEDKQVATANARFVTDAHPDGYGPAKAGMINAAVKKYLCPKAWN